MRKILILLNILQLTISYIQASDSISHNDGGLQNRHNVNIRIVNVKLQAVEHNSHLRIVFGVREEIEHLN